MCCRAFLQWVPWRQWISREFSGKIRKGDLVTEVRRGYNVMRSVRGMQEAAGDWRIIATVAFSHEGSLYPSDYHSYFNGGVRNRG